ncbi:MAG: diaminopimelate epimerase [Clostridiales bacterium]|nr:diaminopimelate epimerase [Clostridiales bacterium]
MRFTKMEGIGNDYIYINGFEEKVLNASELSIKMSRCHFGCGSDGLIMILPSQVADFRMQMFNNDGSESEMCGNGIRCVAKYCYDRGLTEKTEFTIESGGGIKVMTVHVGEDGTVETVRVDMGQAELDGLLIPSRIEGNPVVMHELMVEDHVYPVTLVNVGNPHAVTFVDDVKAARVTTDGPKIECHAAFPKKINAEFVHVIDRGHIEMRVWERGTGETLACGTGACASAVASMLNGFCDRKVEVSLIGGKLGIEWNEDDNHIYMTGAATFVYDGVWLQDM